MILKLREFEKLSSKPELFKGYWSALQSGQLCGLFLACKVWVEIEGKCLKAFKKLIRKVSCSLALAKNLVLYFVMSFYFTFRSTLFL